MELGGFGFFVDGFASSREWDECKWLKSKAKATANRKQKKSDCAILFVLPENDPNPKLT